MTEAHELVAFLSASETRATLLVRLRAAGSAERRTCYDWTDASRRTVKRALSNLADRHLIRAEEGSVQVTALGATVADRYETFVEDVRLARRLRPFLRRVPAGALDVDLRHFADAEVVTAAEGSPYAPMDRVLELRRGATRLRELSTIVASESVGQLAERLEREDLDVEIVITADALARARSNPDYEDAFAATRDAEDLSLFATEAEVPFLLGILDDTVALSVTDEDGMPAATVVTDAAPVREWALDRFERVRRDARELDGSTPPVEGDRE